MSSNSTTPKWHDVRSAIARWLLVALLLPVFAVHRIAFWLDEFLFPRLGKTALASPLFIVGLPRSGTTYFHRLLCSQRHAFTALPLWELLFAPALCEKHFVWLCYRIDSAVGAPIQRLLDFIGSICSTGLCDPEEDYLALLPFDGCFLRVLLFPLLAKSWALAFPNALTANRRRELLSIYRGVLLRHQAFRGSHLRIVSKNPSFTLWTDFLAEVIPEARFVGLRREPISVVGSQLSSIAKTLSTFGHRCDDVRIAWKFVAMLSLFWNELELWKRDSRFDVVEFDELMHEPFSVVLRTLEQLNVDPSGPDLERLETLCLAGRNYRSSHRYELHTFGLDEAEVLESFAASGTVSTRHEFVNDQRTSDSTKPSELQQQLL
jgi:hypothetical protein